MPGNVDEAKWNEAKAQVRKEYPELSEDGEKFYKIVQSIYQNMEGKKEMSFHERVESRMSK